MTSPVIQNLRYMADVFGHFGAAEYEIKILCAIVHGTESVCLIDNTLFCHEKVTDIIMRMQRSRLKSGLKWGSK